MINLIPNVEKKIMRRGFYLRLATLCLLALGFCFLIAGVSMIPAYVLSKVKKDVANSKIETNKNTAPSVSNLETLKAIADLKSKVATVEKAEKANFILSKTTIDQILNSKMPDIKITEISYNQSPQQKVSIRGVAPSRERLLLFRQALENNPNFKNVDLPISNFVKGSNINFYLNLLVQ